MAFTFYSNEEMAAYVSKHPNITSFELYNCPAAVTVLTLPRAVTYLSVKKCPGFKSLTLPAPVSKVVIEDCLELCSVQLPDSVTQCMLSGCPQMTISRLPSSLFYVWVENCPKIKNLPLPEGSAFSLEAHPNPYSFSGSKPLAA